MSKADVLFVNMCEKILKEGFSSEGQTVRARWEDGTPAHTIKTFGVVNRYDLSEEFPALTLRPTAIKSNTLSLAIFMRFLLLSCISVAMSSIALLI